MVQEAEAVGIGKSIFQNRKGRYIEHQQTSDGMQSARSHNITNLRRYEGRSCEDIGEFTKFEGNLTATEKAGKRFEEPGL